MLLNLNDLKLLQFPPSLSLFFLFSESLNVQAAQQGFLRVRGIRKTLGKQLRDPSPSQALVDGMGSSFC